MNSIITRGCSFPEQGGARPEELREEGTVQFSCNKIFSSRSPKDINLNTPFSFFKPHQGLKVIYPSQVSDMYSHPFKPGLQENKDSIL